MNSTPARKSFWNDIKRLFSCLSKKRKSQLLLLFLLQLASALSEIISLGSIVPFLAALTDSTELMKKSYVVMITDYTGITQPHELIVLFACIFASAIVLANVLRFSTLWAQLHLSAAISTDLGMQQFERILAHPYSYFVRNNSSDLIANTTNDLSNTLGVLQGVLMILTNGLITLFLVIGLFIYNPLIASLLSIIITIAYACSLILVKKKLYYNSQINSDGYRQMIKSLQEGFGGIRNIILGRKQGLFVKQYESGDRPFRNSAASNSVLRQVPRYVIESVGVIAICSLIILLTRKTSNFSEIIPLMGFLGLAAQRLLPAMQQLYASLSTILGIKTSLHRTLDTLLYPIDPLFLAPPPEPLNLKGTLQAKNLWYSHSNDENWTITDLSFSIKAKTRVALVGHTGSGKSTVSDLILGLITPQKGHIEIDGHIIKDQNLLAWQRSIANVPQHIFLLDSTIYENIAFGIERQKIDIVRVIESAKLAKIHDFIESLENQYETKVGERGIRLSGGQLQRIGIARALYQKPSMVIFDEATSALDNTTEKEVMAAIDGLSSELTIVLIAHRLSTIKRADNIIVLDKGRLVAEGTYDYLIKHSEHFKELVKSSEFVTTTE